MSSGGQLAAFSAKPPASALSAGGLRRRSGSAAAPSGGAKQTGLLRSYTDDPGLKLTPVRVFAPVGVLVGSLAYIVVVFMLHVVGKLVSFGKK